MFLASSQERGMDRGTSFEDLYEKQTCEFSESASTVSSVSQFSPKDSFTGT